MHAHAYLYKVVLRINFLRSHDMSGKALTQACLLENHRRSTAYPSPIHPSLPPSLPTFGKSQRIYTRTYEKLYS
jgi:hypothetical protein